MIHRLSIKNVSGDQQRMQRFCDDLNAAGYPLPVHAFHDSIVLTWGDADSEPVYARFCKNLPALMDSWDAGPANGTGKSAEAILGRAYTGDEPAYVHGFLSSHIVRRIDI